MLECEVKLLDIDISVIQKLMKSIGATSLWSQIVLDVYLDDIVATTPCRSRVRFTNAKTLLTCKYKLPSKRSKIAYEVDTPLPKWYIMPDTLWWSEVNHMRVKRRTSYTRWWYQFDIDEYPLLSPILEIEWANEESIQKIISTLWLQNHKQFLGGAKALYKHYNIWLPEFWYNSFSRLLSVIRCW